jgi:hypothetical protein
VAELLWSGSTGFLAASSNLSFATIAWNLPISGVSVGVGKIGYLYYQFVGQANGSVFVDLTPTLRDGSGNIRSVQATGSLGMVGPRWFVLDQNWDDVASGGGSITAQVTTAFSSYMGCLQAMVVAVVFDPEQPATFGGLVSSGSSSTASRGSTRPTYDWPQGGSVGSTVNATPSILSSDWTAVQTASRDFTTTIGQHITLNAGLAYYSGPRGAGPTTMSWGLGGSGSWEAATYSPSSTVVVGGGGAGKSRVIIVS